MVGECKEFLCNDKLFVRDCFTVFRNTPNGCVRTYPLCNSDSSLYTFLRAAGTQEKMFFETVVTNRFFPSVDMFNDKGILKCIWEDAKLNNSPIISFLFVEKADTIPTEIQRRILLKKILLSYSLEINNDYVLRGAAGRNVRKAKRFLELKPIETFDEYKRILNLGNRKTKLLDCQEIIEAQIEFLMSESKKRVIGFAATFCGKVIAGMISILVNGELFMLVNNYDEKYLGYRPNDLLYFSLIRYAQSKTIKCINWGEVDELDVGLQYFKQKYSSTVINKVSLHFLSRVDIG